MASIDEPFSREKSGKTASTHFSGPSASQPCIPAKEAGGGNWSFAPIFEVLKDNFSSDFRQKLESLEPATAEEFLVDALLIGFLLRPLGEPRLNLCGSDGLYLSWPGLAVGMRRDCFYIFRGGTIKTFPGFDELYNFLEHVMPLL